MKILVTGAAGFVGSHTCVELFGQGHEVVGVDNLSSYYSPELKKLRINQILRQKQVDFLKLDLINRAEIDQLIKSENFETVIHLAAQPGVRTPLNRSYEYIEAFTNILQSVVENEIPNFLYASSSSVYGNSKNFPYSETDQNIAPVSIYGATKRANELLATAYVRNSMTRARGLRFFTVYGPWGRPDMAYLRIINSGLQAKKFKRFGDGSVKRDFTFISDITQQILNLVNELQNHGDGYSDVVNIGGGNPYSLNDLIEEISSQLGIKIEVESVNRNENDTVYTSANTIYQISLTGIKPQISLQEGIKKTIAWVNLNGFSQSLANWVDSTN